MQKLRPVSNRILLVFFAAALVVNGGCGGGVNAAHSLLRMVVSYQPKGLLGEAYWFALYPLHVLVFNGMHREISRRASRSSVLPATAI